MSALTPPQSGQQLSADTSLTADTTTDALEESIFETEDEFDRSVAAMDWDTSTGATEQTPEPDIQSDVPKESVDVTQQ